MSQTARLAGTDLFLFVGGALALDLVNTELHIRGRPRDVLATPDAVARWWRAAQAHHTDLPIVRAAGAPQYDDALLARLRELRAALRSLFGNLIAAAPPLPADLDVLNTPLRASSPALERMPDGALHMIYSATDRDSAIVLPIALAAVQLITTGEPARFHHCSNARCVLLFYDQTKSATRRWCSAACMNRARSSQHYQSMKLRP